MKRKLLLPILLVCAALMMPGCASGDAGNSLPQVVVPEPIAEPIQNEIEPQPVEVTPSETAAEPEAVVEESREGMIRSELTNEWIDASLENQRPIGVMVDNEKTALDHYGINDADIIYEVMNSTENDRVTRLFVLMKDYEGVEQLGSIRSARVTNFYLAWEYNAILIHDGGPAAYITDYVKSAYTNNLSGGFARFSNGKPTEFTEYVTWEDYKNPSTGKSYDGLEDRIKSAGYSREYNSYYPGKHFRFSNSELTLDGQAGSTSATAIDLPFPHNSSKLKYNESNGTYDYYEYGSAHVDAKTGETTTFKNVILQSADFEPCKNMGYPDQNGYIQYNLIGSGTDGYYITNGTAVPITWMKGGDTSVTHYYYKSTGEEIQLNTGKTYIALVPSDSWGEVVVR